MAVTEGSEQMSLHPSPGTSDKATVLPVLALRTNELMGVTRRSKDEWLLARAHDVKTASSLRSPPEHG